MHPLQKALSSLGSASDNNSADLNDNESPRICPDLIFEIADRNPVFSSVLVRWRKGYGIKSWEEALIAIVESSQEEIRRIAKLDRVKDFMQANISSAVTDEILSSTIDPAILDLKPVFSKCESAESKQRKLIEACYVVDRFLESYRAIELYKINADNSKNQRKHQ